MTTMAERWIAEGRAEGRVEAARTILLQLMSSKFGELPEHAQQRIQTAREEVLSRWMKRFLNADSLDSMFSD